MKILVLQHIPLEDPGHLKELMLQDGHQLDVVELDEGGEIPAQMEKYDGLVCMGGPMDTWMEQQYPWLVAEKQRIREFVVQLQKPFLGVCLGAQLLGEVLGGEVVRSAPPEIGVLDVDVDAADDALFGAFPAQIKALQWHSYEVTGLEQNPHVALLASSPSTACQAFRYQSHAYGVQFHIEIRADTVRSWGDVPEYKDALEDTLGAGALAAMDALATKNMADMNRHAGLLYDGFNKLMAAR